MDEALLLFERFCSEHGIEANDERKYIWLSALASTKEQEPVAYGTFCADGSLNALFDYLPPTMRPVPQPLYANPIAAVPRAPITSAQIRFIWETYYAVDNDIEGMVRFVERYHRSK